MIEVNLPTPLPTPVSELETRKPRKRELKNLTKPKGRGGIWYFHKRVNGKKEFLGRKTPFSLDTRDLAVAKTKRDALLRAGNGAEIDRVLGRDNRAAAKLGVIFAAYRKAPTVRANEDTRERNIADCVRMVKALRGGSCVVEELGCDILTKAMVKEWQSLRLAAAVKDCAGDLAALEAAKRTINSLLTHVQSLFSAEAIDDYGHLYLPPNIAEFAAALPVAARKQEEPTQLTDDAVAGLLGQIAELKKDDQGAWAAFQLMTWGGLRNKECLHARKSWLEAIPRVGAYRLAMKPTEDFLPKGNSRATVIPAAIADEILALLPIAPLEGAEQPDDHLVTGKTFTDRNEAIYRRLNAWLKSHGVGADGGKIAYRLRKYFLAKVAEQQGVMLAQAAAGHASMRTTEDHYIGRPKMAEPIKLAAAVG